MSNLLINQDVLEFTVSKKTENTGDLVAVIDTVKSVDIRKNKIIIKAVFVHEDLLNKNLTSLFLKGRGIVYDTDTQAIKYDFYTDEIEVVLTGIGFETPIELQQVHDTVYTFEAKDERTASSFLSVLNFEKRNRVVTITTQG